MKVQCTDAQSAEAIAQHAAQYRFKDYGVSISANGDTLEVAPANALVATLSVVISKVFGLFLARPEREADQQQAVQGDTVAP
ncbi:hypothetical protein HOP60_09140 [Halomonas daqingensis]|uniref:Uncharacterized protein n=1 Tax=Billgrantia desiderata TaxID=52021 RepID=A0ABS9B4S2_9GAMM|nr:hypothetical protein [Halomonas desiderata]MCE8042324.1 hypothetical protein [Halomonas desiderata]MCE8046899.1 hypothetical protein [Halomonas desiderata]